jgi:Cu/Ag efflux protein CusF
MTALMRWAAAIAALVLLTLQPALADDAASNRPAGGKERVVEAEATVESIDQATRKVVLQREDGTEVTVVADDSIKNLPQVKVGDHVQISYLQAVAYRVLPAGETAPNTTASSDVATAKAGEKPGGAALQEITVVATIVALNKGKGTVQLRGPAGNVTEVEVENPDNLKKVKVGDRVQITYTEALAISVSEPSTESGSSTPSGDAGASTSGAAPSGSGDSQPGAAEKLNREELEKTEPQK